MAAVERFRATHSNVSSLHVMAFLYVCENEGLNVSELAHVCTMSRPTASRIVRALASPERRQGLIECRRNPADRKGRLLFLTEKGLRLRAELDWLIRERRTIILNQDRPKQDPAPHLIQTNGCSG